MSSRELERVEVMGRVKRRDLKLKDAALVLELSYRQVKRFWKQYGQRGGQGLKHGNAGKVSNRSKPGKFRGRVLHLIRKKYWGEEGERFGPTLAVEHLAEEHGLRIDHEILRRWMMGEGLWSRQRKHTEQRKRRERRGRIYRIAGTDTKTDSPGSALCTDSRGKESQSRSSVATKLQIHGFSDGPPDKSKHHSLHCTLPLRPKGLRSSAQRNDHIYPQKGTLLMS